MERAVQFARLPVELREPNIARVMREGFDRFNLGNTARQYIALYDSLISPE
jgi:hypothetical protein